MKKEEKNSNKKTKIILIILAIIILLGLFLFWFFNRKFDIIFEITPNDKYTIKVKYNQTIKNEDIKTKEELGENFIDWYEVVSIEKEILADDRFDFTTKIKSKKTLRALYKVEREKVETILISFDTKGGSKVDDVKINKGSELTLPKSPTKDGYTFKSWTLKNSKVVKNKTKFNENTTLYANWKKKTEKITITFDAKGGSNVDKVKINKGSKLTLPKNPTKDGYDFIGWTLENGTEVKNKTKFNEDTTLYANWKKKEETISLSLTRKVIHRKGYKTSKANAKVENASGDVIYSIDNDVCVTIDAKTGDIKANEEPNGSATKIRAWKHTCAENDKVVTVTATLPSGKSASVKLTIEKDLILYASNSSIPRSETVTSNGKILPSYENKFSIDANQSVTWSAEADDAYGSCTPTKKTTKSTSYDGNLGAQCTDENYRNTTVTATTDANQKLSIKYTQVVN